MAKFKIDWLVKKSPEWIVASLVQEDGTKWLDVSINKTSKKGEPFPNFDNLMPGHEVEGEFWTSDKDKHYLFPPRVAKTGNSGGFKQKMIDDTMTRKEGSIEKFQASKEESIKLASAQRDAVLITINTDIHGMEDEEIKKMVIKWRNWFLTEFPKDIPPF